MAQTVFYIRKKFSAYIYYILLLLLLVLTGCGEAFVPSVPGTAKTSPVHTISKPSVVGGQLLHIGKNQLFGRDNEPVRLLGVNRSGTEYACIQNNGIFDGPHDLPSVQAMLNWHINAVRVPLNEDCWLNINGVSANYGGANYRQAIADYVTLLISNKITPILDLHWSAPGNTPATSLLPMPDRDHSLTFWKQVATAYKNNTAVVFDLFNEPYPDNNHDTTTGWKCWLSGTNPTSCPFGTAGLTYNAAGMQELLTAVRNTGARNVILLGGIQHSNSLDQWLTYKPTDPLNELAPSWHVYNNNQCKTLACWQRTIVPLMQNYPLVGDEIGENDNAGSFLTQVMKFLDAPAPGIPAQSYLAWVWTTNQAPYNVISDYDGTPSTPYGSTYKSHLLSLQ